MYQQCALAYEKVSKIKNVPKFILTYLGDKCTYLFFGVRSSNRKSHYITTIGSTSVINKAISKILHEIVPFQNTLLG